MADTRTQGGRRRMSFTRDNQARGGDMPKREIQPEELEVVRVPAKPLLDSGRGPKVLGATKDEPELVERLVGERVVGSPHWRITFENGSERLVIL